MTDHDLGPTEDRLRAALRLRALRVEPTERFSDVLDRVEAGPPRRRWVPIAAAAAVAAVVAGLWLANLPQPTEHPAAPPASASSSATPTPAPSASGTPSPTASPSPSETPASLAALPVYLVAANDPGLRLYRLQREWLSLPGVTRDADAQTRAEAALRLALAGQAPAADGYVQAWGDVALESVRLTPSLITVTLSGPGPSGFAADTQRVAVQQLVWTVQAATGSGAPVRFVLADGGAELFQGLPTDRTYDRPPSDRTYEDLASLWVTSPTRGQVLPAGTVTAQGEASVFEATFQWELLRDGTVVRSGTAMASEGAPGRGTWTVDLGRLEPGGYVLRVFEPSMADDTTVAAETVQPFTVR